jgi:hypothetical protein
MHAQGARREDKQRHAGIIVLYIGCFPENDYFYHPIEWPIMNSNRGRKVK